MDEATASRVRRARRERQMDRIRQQVATLTQGMELIQTMTRDANVGIAAVTCKNVHEVAKSALAAAAEIENG